MQDQTRFDPNGCVDIASLISGYVSDRIDFKVDRLARKFCLSKEDRRDYRQEFIQTVIAASRHYRPGLARWTTYVCAALDKRYLHIVRHLMAVERNLAMKPMPLEELDETCRDFISDSAADSFHGYSPDDRRMDVAQAIACMPAHLQRICQLLMVYPAAEVARTLGVSAVAIDRAKKKIRGYFEDAGLGLPE